MFSASRFACVWVDPDGEKPPPMTDEDVETMIPPDSLRRSDRGRAARLVLLFV